ncbi:MAG: hypothetical protein KAJ51_12935, partial [Thermoplasmata archaeon]|nr:hypothetical protein [Thermoplasmata archaeon]
GTVPRTPAPTGTGAPGMQPGAAPAISGAGQAPGSTPKPQMLPPATTPPTPQTQTQAPASQQPPKQLQTLPQKPQQQ